MNGVCFFGLIDGVLSARIPLFCMSKKKEQSFYALARPLLQKYLPPYKWLVVWGIVAGVVAAAASGFGLPVIVQKVCPVVFGEVPAPEWVTAWLSKYVSAEDMPMVTLMVAALVIPIVMGMRGLATYVNAFFLSKAGVGVMNGLRLDLFSRLQWVSFSYHDKNQRGALMALVIQFTQNMQLQLVQVLNDVIVQPLTLLAAVSYLIYAAVTNHESAVLLGNLLISCLCIPLVRYVGKMMVKKMRQALAGMSVITSNVEETLSAQREVRAFNLEARQESVLAENIKGFNSVLIKMSAWQSSLSPAIEIVSALALSYSLYRGCGDGLTLEAFTAIATAFYFCYDPIKRLGSVANQTQIMSLMLRRFEGLLNARDETPEPKNPVALPTPVKGAVDFEKVSFAYEAGKLVLRNLTVHVEPGEIVALVGPSGSGKTTFINLICRFYDPQKGTVKIDGVNVKDISREDRTKAVGLVSQFAALFRDTIAENIRVGNPKATDAEVRSAGDLACVTEFAEMKPEGYNLMLAEGGSGLSGGQKQRVSIARAILKNAPILILDEATSALDMKSEAHIQNALDGMAQNRTTFIIAHRFSTIRMAQRILVFDEGRIIADGSHDELYENCQMYRSLYDEQAKQGAVTTEGKEQI